MKVIPHKLVIREYETPMYVFYGIWGAQCELVVDRGWWRCLLITDHTTVWYGFDGDGLSPTEAYETARNKLTGSIERSISC